MTCHDELVVPSAITLLKECSTWNAAPRMPKKADVQSSEKLVTSLQLITLMKGATITHLRTMEDLMQNPYAAHIMYGKGGLTPASKSVVVTY